MSFLGGSIVDSIDFDAAVGLPTGHGYGRGPQGAPNSAKKPKFKRPDNRPLPMLLREVIEVLKEHREAMTRKQISSAIGYPIAQDDELSETIKQNPKIAYNRSDNTFKFFSKYDTIVDSNSLLARLRHEVDGLVVDDELISDTYDNIDADITQLLLQRKCFAIRRGHRRFEKKCQVFLQQKKDMEMGHATASPTMPIWGCNLYAERCEYCGKTNRDLILFPTDAEIDTDSVKLDDELKSLWNRMPLPVSIDDVRKELNLEQKTRDVSHIVRYLPISLFAVSVSNLDWMCQGGRSKATKASRA
eukprot:Filipodium_phascolosomae@DN1371_c0_g1_i2.p1